MRVIAKYICPDRPHTFHIINYSIRRPSSVLESVDKGHLDDGLTSPRPALDVSVSSLLHPLACGSLCRLTGRVCASISKGYLEFHPHPNTSSITLHPIIIHYPLTGALPSISTGALPCISYTP
jgi:hypothetical protein